MSESQPDMRSRFSGCLVGGAVGDALGAPFEGYWGHLLPAPDDLMADFAEFEGYPPGQYTDDTQLTIATVESIIRMGAPDTPDIARSIASLWKNQAVIGPGGACTFAAHAFLESGDWSRCGAPVGQAGNGTAMRTAALGLSFVADPDALPGVAAEVSRVTHRDPRSVAGGVAIAKAAQLLATSEMVDPGAFCAAVAASARPYEPSFAGLIREIPDRLRESREAARVAIAWAGSSGPEFERPIITPFVIPTVLASLWAVLRHPRSWADAVCEAIGLGGDVDTLGAIVGALAGTRLGLSAIPSHLADRVVDASRLKKLGRRYFEVVTALGSSEAV